MLWVFASRESLNHCAKCGQTFIDLGALLNTVSRSILFVITFRASQVNERNLTLCSLSSLCIISLNDNRENHVRARWHIIIFCAEYLARFDACFKGLGCLCIRGYWQDRSILDLNHSGLRIFSDFKLHFRWLGEMRLWSRLRARDKAINEVVNIKLYHVTLKCHSVMAVYFHALFETIEFFYCPWNNTWLLWGSLHCIGLAAASLAISENANVKAIQRALD